MRTKEPSKYTIHRSGRGYNKQDPCLMRLDTWAETGQGLTISEECMSTTTKSLWIWFYCLFIGCWHCDLGSPTYELCLSDRHTYFNSLLLADAYGTWGRGWTSIWSSGKDWSVLCSFYLAWWGPHLLVVTDNHVHTRSRYNLHSIYWKPA